MRKFIFITSLTLISLGMFAQCELPYNTGCRIFQFGIEFTGEIKHTVNSLGHDYFEFDPSLLSLKEHQITGDTISRINGKWFFTWRYANGPVANSWRKFDFSCSTVGFNLQMTTNMQQPPDFVELDFFYIQEQDSPCQGATFKNSIVWHKSRNVTTGTIHKPKYKN